MATAPNTASRVAEPPGAEPVIETRGPRMRYGSTDVLHGVDIRVHRGEVVALLGAISGVFYPITALPDRLQWIGQAFPIYWLGLGMRSALLPDAMSAADIGGSWRHLETVGVLGVWAIIGFVGAPIVLRRMARRESGSSVAGCGETTLQRPT